MLVKTCALGFFLHSLILMLEVALHRTVLQMWGLESLKAASWLALAETSWVRTGAELISPLDLHIIFLSPFLTPNKHINLILQVHSGFKNYFLAKKCGQSFVHKCSRHSFQCLVHNRCSINICAWTNDSLNVLFYSNVIWKKIIL